MPIISRNPKTFHQASPHLQPLMQRGVGGLASPKLLTGMHTGSLQAVCSAFPTVSQQHPTFSFFLFLSVGGDEWASPLQYMHRPERSQCRCLHLPLSNLIFFFNLQFFANDFICLHLRMSARTHTCRRSQRTTCGSQFVSCLLTYRSCGSNLGSQAWWQ